MKIFRGSPAAEGIACATAVVSQETAAVCEVKSLQEAVSACLTQVHSMRDKALRELGSESAEIFSAYEMLLSDSYLIAPIQAYQTQGMDLLTAVETAMNERAQVFERAKSEYMRQRADDIGNLKRMLLREISGNSVQFPMPEGDGAVIVFAESLSPADTMSLDQTRLTGLVTRCGGTTSHVVILAKTLGIPAVTGFSELQEIEQGSAIILNGESGEIIMHPDETALGKALLLQLENKRILEQLREIPRGSVATTDGETVHISVNIGLSKDLNDVDFESVDGVGLYRTEFLFSERSTTPSRQEQIAEYKKVFDRLSGKNLIVRTLDIGGDKQIPFLPLGKEENPFLGCRGIRLCFRYEKLLREQFAALMLAAEGRAFSVMFPMIDTVCEFKKAKQIWNEVRKEVMVLGIVVSDEIQLGIMIETPAAVMCADLFARYVDFASIGTNDLTQYIMAADRGNPDTGVVLSHYNPAVLRAVHHVISTFRTANVKVSVCGEAGSDPAFLSLMIAMGLRYVSVSKSMINRARYTVLHTSCKAQQALLQQTLQDEDESEIRRHIAL